MNDKPEEATSQTTVVPPLPLPSRWPAFMALFSILAVVALLGVGQYYWQNMQSRFSHLRQVMEQSRLQQEILIRQVEQTSQAFQQQQQLLKTQEELIRRQTLTITIQAEKLETERKRLANQGDAVRQSLENLHDEIGRSGHEWRAAEAAYLLELGQSRLRLEHDPNTAISALESADERLRQTGDTRWHPVREAISEDLKQLRSVQDVDRKALGKTLLRLALGVEQIPLRPTRYQPRHQHDERQPEGGQERNLDTLIQDGWDAFESLVSIHRDDWTVSSRVGPEHRDSVRQNLRLQLDSARFGLLRRDMDLYQGSLETAQAWLQTFFKPEATETLYYLDEISRLRQAQIIPALPDLAPTLNALHALLNANDGTSREADSS